MPSCLDTRVHWIQKVESIEAEKAILSDNLLSCNLQVASLDGKLFKIGESLNITLAENLRLTTQVSDFLAGVASSNELKECTAEKIELANTNGKLIEKLEANQDKLAEIPQLKADLKELQGQLRTTSGDLNKCVNGRSALENKNGELVERIKTVNNLVEQKKQEIGELNKNTNALQRQLNNATQKSDVCDAKLEQLRSEHTTIKESLRETREDLGLCNKEYNALQRELTESNRTTIKCQTNLENKNDQYEVLQVLYRDLQQEERAQDKALDNCNAEYGKLEGKFNTTMLIVDEK